MERLALRRKADVGCFDIDDRRGHVLVFSFMNCADIQAIVNMYRNSGDAPPIENIMFMQFEDFYVIEGKIVEKLPRRKDMSVSQKYRKALTIHLATGKPQIIKDDPTSKGFKGKAIPITCRRCKGLGLEKESTDNCQQCGGRGAEKMTPKALNRFLAKGGSLLEKMPGKSLFDFLPKPKGVPMSDLAKLAQLSGIDAGIDYNAE